MRLDWEQGRPLSSEVIQRARAGDERAVGCLCDRLRPGLEAFVRRRLSGAAARFSTPEDVTQGVLLEMVRQLPTLALEATEEDLWRRVHRTAGFRVRDLLRKHRLELGESALASRLDVPERELPSMGTVTRADSRRWLEALIERLPPKYAEVVRLCALEGHTSVQAARVLGIRDDTVRKRYETARRALRRRVARPTDG